MNFAFAVIAGLLLACGQFAMKKLSNSIALDLASIRTALLSPYTYMFLTANFSSSVFYILSLRGESLLFVLGVVYVTMAMAVGLIDVVVVGSTISMTRMFGFALAIAAVGLLVRS